MDTVKFDVASPPWAKMPMTPNIQMKHKANLDKIRLKRFFTAEKIEGGKVFTGDEMVNPAIT